ncbi:MAG: hypothetical protein HY868_08570 [Chloroflexi bacterium]|nr:hypothetical protein [Chloroflexota bacterium]
MSRTMKIVLLVSGMLIVICALTMCVLLGVIMPLWAQSVIHDADNPEHAKLVAAKIADYTLPPGYTEKFGSDLTVSQTVLIASSDKTSPAFHLDQITHSNTKLKEMDEQLRGQVQSNDIVRGVTYWFVGERKVKIKDALVPLYITESQSEGITSRHAIGLFPGRGGVVTVRVDSEKQKWDWDLIERFLASIR